MFKKSFIPMIAAMLLVSGCATGRNYEADINALNSRLSALQGQLSAKEQEIDRLQNEMKADQAARLQAESERRELAEKLDSALAEIAAKARERHIISAPKQVDSDLK